MILFELLRAILIVVIALQGLLLLAPPIVISTKNKRWLGDSTARNNSVFIWIDPDQKDYKRVLEQELFDCENKKWLNNLIRRYLSPAYDQKIETQKQQVK